MHTVYFLLYCYTKTTSTNQTTQSSAFQPTNSQITLLLVIFSSFYSIVEGSVLTTILYNVLDLKIRF